MADGTPPPYYIRIDIRTINEEKQGGRSMAKIFIVRIEDGDFDALRQKYGKESLQGTDDEQAMEDFMKEKGVANIHVSV